MPMVMEKNDWMQTVANDGQLYCGIRAVNPFLRGMGPSEKPC